MKKDSFKYSDEGESTIKKSNYAEDDYIGDDSKKEITIDKLKMDLLDQMTSVNDEDDVEKIRQTMKKVKKVESLDSKMSAEEAYKVFERDYLPEAKRLKNILTLSNNEIKKRKEQKQKRPYFRKTAVIFVSVLAVILINFATIAIAGINIFEPFIRWTDELFYKDIDKSPSQNGGTNENHDLKPDEYSDFESIENDYSVKIFKPHYIPDGYELGSIVKTDFVFATYFCAVYENESDSILYTIYIPSSNSEISEDVIEKTSDDIEIVTDNDVDFYIIKNIDWYAISWNNMNLEYKVSGFKNKDDVIKFIKNLKY